SNTVVLKLLDNHLVFFLQGPPTTENYTLSLHDALPISQADRYLPRELQENDAALDARHARLRARREIRGAHGPRHRLARRLLRRSEEHTSELQSPCNLVCRLLLEKKK